MYWNRIARLAVSGGAALLMSRVVVAESMLNRALSDSGQALVETRCVGCHTRDDADHISRISYQRKTPEGWHMTLTRMQHNHGLVLSDAEKDALVKYLADNQGLAPSEAAPYRYVLEQRNNYIEQYNAINQPDGLGVARRCTVCHSYARVALQRRSDEEWRLLLHFHVGQFPAIEYHPWSRVSPWWEEVAPRFPSVLAGLFPLSDDAWQEWRTKPKSDLSGSWRIVGYLPGVGFYSGLRTVKQIAPDRYQTDTAWEFADGHKESRQGSGIVYTGYEWRGRTLVRREDIREIFALSEDGDELSGRWYYSRHSELGGEFRAVRIQPGVSRVLAVEPLSVKIGMRQRVTLYGANLSGTPDFGPQMRVAVVSRSPDQIVVDVSADRAAAVGVRPVRLGSAVSRARVAVYKSVDHVRVEPEYAFSRLGEGGGKIPFVGAQFEAVAYAVDSQNPTDGDRDFAIGVVPAKWTLEPHTAIAKEWDDQLFAGRITANGQFIPAQGGINTARTKGTSNNTGDLTVKATVLIGERVFEGTSHLVVSSAMLFFNPPIR